MFHSAIVKLTRPLPLAFLALLLALPTAAHAFRCGSQLVHEGDSAYEVVAKCGEPADVRRSSVLRPPVIWHYGRPYRVSGDFLELAVEFWTYNLGPNKLMRRLRLEDGRVIEIETLGYGYL